MSSATSTPRTELFSRFVTVNGTTFLVELVRYEGPSSTWLRVEREPLPSGSVWIYEVSNHVPDSDGDTLLDQLRYGLRETRRVMRSNLDNWISFREFAAAEPPANVKGSKRAYYSKLANQCHKAALHAAPKWKLAKQLWKEITRL